MKYEDIKCKLKNTIKDTDSIALTTESHNLTTMPLDGRNISANVAEWFDDVIAKFDITPLKAKAVVSDNGVNVVQ